MDCGVGKHLFAFYVCAYRMHFKIYFKLVQLHFYQTEDQFQPQTRLLSSTGNLELYWPATNLVNATRLSENQAITYGFDTEYCISSITFEYYLGQYGVKY